MHMTATRLSIRKQTAVFLTPLHFQRNMQGTASSQTLMCHFLWTWDHWPWSCWSFWDWHPDPQSTASVETIRVRGVPLQAVIVILAKARYWSKVRERSLCGTSFWIWRMSKTVSRRVLKLLLKPSLKTTLRETWEYPVEPGSDSKLSWEWAPYIRTASLFVIGDVVPLTTWSACNPGWEWHALHVKGVSLLEVDWPPLGKEVGSPQL